MPGIRSVPAGFAIGMIVYEKNKGRLGPTDVVRSGYVFDAAGSVLPATRTH